MLAEDIPTETCDWHRPISIDLRNGLRAGDHCPEEHTEERVFEMLPAEYGTWQAAAGVETPPTVYSPHCPATGPIPGAVVITYPRDGEVFVVEPGYDRHTQSLELTAEAESLVERVTWSIDGEPISSSRWPYTAAWRLRRGRHVVAVNARGQSGDSVAFEVG
jgi:membrane carboxypeptidase/penicillin-binding protein PbpC